MSLQEIKHVLQELSSALSTAKAHRVARVDELPPKTLTPFQQARFNAVCAGVSTSKSKLMRVSSISIEDPLVDHEIAVVLKKMTKELENLEEVPKLELVVDHFAGELAQVQGEKSPEHDLVLPPSIPSEIRAEMEADAQELRACLKAKCFRSVVILAGRLLETALHRKYFEVTGNDLLEKAPGIGLGNLIARLSERNILLDPALGNQIHLINNVRVFSVHTKKEVFQPSEAQAKAITLYTFDVLQKLFNQK